MASTNQTPKLGLPQFVDTDKPGWLTDFNTAMVKIDASVGDQTESIESAKAAANEATQAAQNAITAANAASTAAENASTAAENASTAAATAQSTANNAVTNLSQVMQKLLINGNESEIFQLNTSNNKQLISNKGNTISLISNYFVFSTSQKNQIIVQKTETGEWKLYGRIGIGYSGSTPSADNIVIKSDTAILPTTANFDLSNHGFINGQGGDRSITMNTQPLDAIVNNGVFSITKTIPASSNNIIFILFDSIITTPFNPSSN